MLTDVAILQPQLLERCPSRSMATFINIAPVRWGFVSDISKKAIMANFSAGLVWTSVQKCARECWQMHTHSRHAHGCRHAHEHL